MGKRKITLKQGCAMVIALYFAAMTIFWLCAYEQLNFRDDSTDMLQADGVIGEITQDTVFSQNFTVEEKCDLISITMLMASYNRDNTTHIKFQVADGESIVAETTINCLDIVDNSEHDIVFDNTLELDKGKVYSLIAYSDDGVIGNACTIYYGTKHAAGKVAINAELSSDMQAKLNGEPLGYSFCWSIKTRASLAWGNVYPFAVLGLGAILLIYCIHMVRCAENNRRCLALNFITAFSRYKYLVKQLVARDFKTKYKRSVLGILWSFLNPLLMMIVQYIVFSTLFRSSIPNFSLYLLVGIVCFNFFSECTGMCLGSITGNASLITKVYMPKYIYPVSRALSSGINLLFSLIPLVGVMIITQAPLGKALVLVPIPLICLFVFSLGIGMILATMMVFFRDTQFLWGVISTIWMYMTPIIYPESILPEKYMPIFKLNPMYHIVKCIRTMIMDGVSPEPKSYIIMMVMCFATLLAGGLIFRKNQDKFVLNI